MTSVFRAATIAALVIAALGSPAAAQSLRSLAGWWLAIDDTFPKLWDAGLVAMEELLIVNADGRFEDRTMNFYSGDAETCAKTRVCSDLPMIAYGRLRIADNVLTIGDRGAPPNRLDSEITDPMIRRAAFSAAQGWLIQADGGRITLRNTNMTRSFARIEPQRLRRLRAGMMASSLSAQKHWRCFLGNAMGSTQAFALMPRAPGAAAPPFLDRYLKVASYLMTLSAMAKIPVADDPARRDYLAKDTEQLMVEEFPGVQQPVMLADAQRLKAQLGAIETRVRDKLKERSGGGPAPVTQGRPVISDAEIDAFAQAASEEPEAKRLFCRS